MISPSEINTIAAKYEEENYDFRRFLKERANSKTLDAQFLKLHNELFADHDCCKCNNCCRSYSIVLDNKDIERISQHLGQTKDEFMREHLEKSEYDPDSYKINKQPCTFLCADGKCSINEIKPAACKGFPYTDHRDRLASMLGVVSFAEECPVVFEILQRLKKIYRFRYRS